MDDGLLIQKKIIELNGTTAIQLGVMRKLSRMTAVDWNWDGDMFRSNRVVSCYSRFPLQGSRHPSFPPDDVNAWIIIFLFIGRDLKMSLQETAITGKCDLLAFLLTSPIFFFAVV